MIADISIYPQLDKWPVHRISMHSSCSYIIYMGRGKGRVFHWYVHERWG